MVEERSVPISALQHFVFCPRQCALIHTECLWKENALTFLGKRDHARVETARGTTKGALHEARSVQLVSIKLGIHGISDVIEYESTTDKIKVTPIEYKHGKPKPHFADEVQLCAQALCLEEMHDCRIEHGFLYYHQLRHRVRVDFSDHLRELTIKIIGDTRSLLNSDELPKAVKRKDCEACSLYDHCLPTPKDLSVFKYNNRLFCKLLKDETTP
ncbi:MAG: CRISPR-associated protein Cas4 [Akkermansia sp.]|nr:CRISPR-associated protein Cas4 [Akkermansia sp.]